MLATAWRSSDASMAWCSASDALSQMLGPDDGCFLFSDSCLPEDGVWAPGCVDTDVSVDAADCP